MANEIKCPFCGKITTQDEKNRCWCGNPACPIFLAIIPVNSMRTIIDWKAKAKRLDSVVISLQNISRLSDRISDSAYQIKGIIDAEQEEQDAAKF